MGPKARVAEGSEKRQDCEGPECQTQELEGSPEGTREPWKSLEQGSSTIRCVF